MTTDYVSELSLPIYNGASPQAKTIGNLLWGDRVQVGTVSGEYTQVSARGFSGSCFVKTAGLGGQSLLEFYFRTTARTRSRSMR